MANGRASSNTSLLPGLLENGDLLQIRKRIIMRACFSVAGAALLRFFAKGRGISEGG
jgi:hypothetical protein